MPSLKERRAASQAPGRTEGGQFCVLDDRLTFGKHQGRRVRYVVENDPDYIVWVIENVDDVDFDDEVSELLYRATDR